VRGATGFSELVIGTFYEHFRMGAARIATDGRSGPIGAGTGVAPSNGKFRANFEREFASFNTDRAQVARFCMRERVNAVNKRLMPSTVVSFGV
jgi:hypothetical protein